MTPPNDGTASGDTTAPHTESESHIEALQGLATPHVPAEILVTRPSLPDLGEFVLYLEGIWRSQTLTNLGPLHNRLEKELADYLSVSEVILMSNGTAALIASLSVLGGRGKVITTPFSFIATAHSIVLSGLSPVFVDINANTLSMDTERLERALDEEDDVVAILDVHCYGFPADVESIERIASKHRIPVVYDAAHAFKTGCHCGNLLQHGDIAALSFHATKVFSTIEGGAVIPNNPRYGEAIRRYRNFGYATPDRIPAVGTNSKLSEIAAAFGLASLARYEENWSKRRTNWTQYQTLLADRQDLVLLEPPNLADWNFAYAPALLAPHLAGERSNILEGLARRGIFPRAYFAPLITQTDAYRGATIRGPLNIANEIASRVVCLPLAASMSPNDVERVVHELDEEVKRCRPSA